MEKCVFRPQIVLVRAGPAHRVVWEPLEVDVRSGLILLLGFALGAFQIFSYSVTGYALNDLIGRGAISFILTTAFCAADLGVMAINPSNDTGRWFIYGAWFLVLALNSLLVWWGVSLALMSRQFVADGLGQQALVGGAPAIVMLLYALIRILLVGAFVTLWQKMMPTTRNRLRTAPPRR